MCSYTYGLFRSVRRYAQKASLARVWRQRSRVRLNITLLRNTPDTELSGEPKRIEPAERIVGRLMSCAQARRRG